MGSQLHHVTSAWYGGLALEVHGPSAADFLSPCSGVYNVHPLGMQCTCGAGRHTWHLQRIRCTSLLRSSIVRSSTARSRFAMSLEPRRFRHGSLCGVPRPPDRGSWWNSTRFGMLLITWQHLRRPATNMELGRLLPGCAYPWSRNSGSIPMLVETQCGSNSGLST